MDVAQTVAELGEEALIALIAAHLPEAGFTPVGIGDDGAVAELPGPAVLSTDMLVEGSDFRSQWLDPFRLGVKAAAQNISDVLAMGAVAHSLLLTIGMPPETPSAVIDEFAQGFAAEARRAGCGVIGGDISAAPELTISVTAMGYLDGSPALLRSGARPGDGVFLAGRLGYAAAGLALLESGVRLGEDSALDPFIEAQLGPQPDYEGAARIAGWAHSCIDTSDGLARDLTAVARASHVDVTLDAPVLWSMAEELADAARELRSRHTDEPDEAAVGETALEWVLRGGEDHGFICAGPQGSPPVGLIQIGVCAPGAGSLLIDGKPVTGSAFTHFA